MATNKYINNYNVASEQNLTNSLIMEAIQFKGIDVRYMKRSQLDINVLTKEDPTNKFVQGREIEMWPASVDGFDGDSMFSSIQLDISRQCTFVVSKTRFKEEFPDIGHPQHGDLIYMPVTNSLLEIKKVNKDSPFFENGKQFVYELVTELFNYSYEDVESESSEIDDILAIAIKNDDKAYAINDKVQETVSDDYGFDVNNTFGE